MWLLIWIIYSGPMEIKRISIMENYYQEKHCKNRLQQAINIGIPNTATMACVFYGGNKVKALNGN